MFGFIRLGALGFLVLSVVYLLAAFYMRMATRARLEREWDAGGQSGTRDAYVEEGMQAYYRSTRRKLLVGIYVVPFLIVVTMVYVTNFM